MTRAEARVGELRAYIDEHHHLPGREEPLGRWVHHIRRVRHDIYALVADVVTATPTLREWQQEVRLSELEAYIDEHGHRPPVRHPLSKWAAQVRTGGAGAAHRARVEEILTTVPPSAAPPADRRIMNILTPDVIDDVAGMLRRGLSDRAIERACGVTRDRVRVIRAELGIPAWAPPTPRHGTDARYQQGCRCDDCRETHAIANALKHQKARPRPSTPFPAEKTARIVQLHAEDQARTRQNATRHRRPWTEAELRVALDYSHSATAAAEILGRTRSSILHIRQRHKNDRTSSGPLPRGKRATREP